MKRTSIIALFMICCSVFCYGQQSFFDKYADLDGVTSVYITKSMLSLFPKGKTNVNGINIGDSIHRGKGYHRKVTQRNIKHPYQERLRRTNKSTRRRRKDHHLLPRQKK